MMKDIGKNIRALRTEKGMTQEELAEALFVTRQTVSNYETGRSRPDINMLMDIAAALGANANCVLYGPPVREDQIRAYKELIVGGSILAVLIIAAAILHPCTDELRRRYIVAPNYLVNLTLDPALLLVLGWCFMRGAGLLLGAKPIGKAWVKHARRGALALLLLTALLLCPFLIWLVSVIVRTAVGNAYEFSFPYVPVYNELLYGIIGVNLKCPAVYSALGGLLWVFGFPRGRGKAEQAGETGAPHDLNS